MSQILDKTIIMIVAISFFIGLTNLVLYLFYRREKNIQKKCTAKISGIVVDYDNRNEMVIPLPIVEYLVNGETYRKKFEYAYYVENSRKKEQKDAFDRKYILSAGKNLQLREIFPKGSAMTVYYNPEKPEKAFVERYASYDRIFRLLIIIFSIIGFVLTAIVLGISYLSWYLFETSLLIILHFQLWNALISKMFSNLPDGLERLISCYL